ncbi:LLM class oxidoreductase [Streptomyces sp.]|uniref:LLM class oxidoreductase n=1 Tax=Streptomyces sp. TaxID=1931 RepID=UPI002F3EF34A
MSDPFLDHPGFSRIYAPDRLTVGLFLPLWPYDGDFRNMSGQAEAITLADRSGFGAVWLRDVPLRTGPNADVGQVYDPWVYAGWLAARTERVTLAFGSAIFTLRHPIDLAKQAASLDQLSGGRLVLGVATGDRPVEFPAYGVDFDSRGARFREAVGMVRDLLSDRAGDIASPLGATHGADLLPKPVTGRVPLVVTGSARQDPQWIARHADGWLVYPGPTATADGPRALGKKIAHWRGLIPGDGFKPVTTNEWIDLVDDPRHPPTPLQGGRILRTGREGLIELLGRWQDAGLNHGALGVQFCTRPRSEVIAEIAEEVLPHFPSVETAAVPRTPVW